jgi:glycerophosphoryl diester phosphodiesterase
MKLFRGIIIGLVSILCVGLLGLFFVYGGVGSRPNDIKSVAHRGYSKEAPENTLPAFVLAKEKGFKYGECDVSFTKDNIAVLLHDDSIDRTSSGKGKISELTYEQALQYDFGSWFSEDYKNIKIPTFDEFIKLCKEIEMHPYIELKGKCNNEQISSLVKIVDNNDMKANVTWISFNYEYLVWVKEADDTARLGYLSSRFNDEILSKTILLRTGKNEVFLNMDFIHTYSWCIRKCKKEKMPVEIWTVNNKMVIHFMNPYISGVTSDCLIANKVLGKEK